MHLKKLMLSGIIKEYYALVKKKKIILYRLLGAANVC
jgi:hypothetical protein